MANEPEFPETISDFFSDQASWRSITSETERKHKSRLRKGEHSRERFSWVLADSGLPWLPLALRFPATKMLREAERVRDHFVSHRSGVAGGGYQTGNRGWKALAIHGISPVHTGDHSQYGYRSEEETPYRWTEIARRCPVTANFFKKRFPYVQFHRVRFAIIEPGGFIYPHKDREKSYLWEVNLALSNPEGCYFKMEGEGYVPYEPGKAFLLDVSRIHAVANFSREERIHIIVHGSGLRSPKWRTLVERSYRQFIDK